MRTVSNQQRWICLAEEREDRQIVGTKSKLDIRIKYFDLQNFPILIAYYLILIIWKFKQDEDNDMDLFNESVGWLWEPALFKSSSQRCVAAFVGWFRFDLVTERQINIVILIVKSLPNMMPCMPCPLPKRLLRLRYNLHFSNGLSLVVFNLKWFCIAIGFVYLKGEIRISTRSATFKPF